VSFLQLHKAIQVRYALAAFREDVRAGTEPLGYMCRTLRLEGFRVTSLRALELLVWTEVEPRGYYRNPPAP
jgi:hypothetical protein